MMRHGLIIDDSAAIRKIARRIIECFQFGITETDDASDGFRSCRREMPDLILIDLHLPDAVEFIAALRRMFKGRRPKVITCSIENHIPLIQRARRAGADDFILKPFYRQIIESKLRDLGFLKPMFVDRSDSEDSNSDSVAAMSINLYPYLNFPLTHRWFQGDPESADTLAGPATMPVPFLTARLDDIAAWPDSK
jgi:two-component system, chemotaxis family, chemotaxis protein CheY